ncbi:MAG: substrate-binding domain-containing protein [Janthinobacterium lividum]
MTVQQRAPKYVDLADQIRTDVQTGTLKAGDRLPSFIELRNEHQISRGTVEKAHALLERDGLIVREQGRGVFVAQPKAMPATGIIGFAGGGFTETRTSLYWAHLLDAIQKEAAREKLQLLLMTETSDPSLWSKIDGLLLSVNDELIYSYLQTLPPAFSCVSILTAIDECSSVMAGDYQGSKEATRYLISLGHTRIGYLIAGHSYLVESRLNGYRDALQEAGIEPSLHGLRQMHPRPVHDSKNEFIEQGRRSVRKWLSDDWHKYGYTALLAQNDNAAIGAIEAFRESGLRVPEDVSVIGFDGNETYDYFSPRLTTVEVPLLEIGTAAVQMLIRKINGQSSALDNIVIPTSLRKGESTAPLIR